LDVEVSFKPQNWSLELGRKSANGVGSMEASTLARDEASGCRSPLAGGGQIGLGGPIGKKNTTTYKKTVDKRLKALEKEGQKKKC